MLKQTKRLAEKFAQSFTEEELNEMQKASAGLRPRNSKKQSRENWFKKHKSKIDLIKKYSETIENEIVRIKEETGDNMENTRTALADAIRDRQKNNGIDKYLMNRVYLSLFRTLCNYDDNPQIMTAD